VIAFLVLVLALYWVQQGNRNAASPPAAPLPFLLTEPGSDWFDVRLHCTIEQKGDVRTLHLRNDYQTQTVGFDVYLRGNLQTAIGHDAQGEFKIFPEKLQGLELKFLRSGNESDRFFQVLDRLYKTNMKSARMVDSFAFDAIPLEGEQNGLAKVKLFGNPNGSEDEYFEVYFNVNFREGWAELVEKDSDYRKPLIAALTKQ
jgi:hypothetical protein